MIRRSLRRAAVVLALLLPTPIVAVPAGLNIHIIAGCDGDSMVGTWMIKNYATQTVTRNITRWYENNGFSSVDYNYPITVVGGQDMPLGCTAWYGDNTGRQSFSLGPPAPLPAPHPNPPKPPAPPPPKPYPENDPTFHYVGSNGFSRGGGGTGLTQDRAVILSFPGVKDLVIDTSFRQANDPLSRSWYISHIGGATSPTTVNDIPPGFIVRSTGENYFSTRDPKVFHVKIPIISMDNDWFQMTMYCGPPAHAPCSVGMKVWVKMKPKGPNPTSPFGSFGDQPLTH